MGETSEPLLPEISEENNQCTTERVLFPHVELVSFKVLKGMLAYPVCSLATTLLQRSPRTPEQHSNQCCSNS